MHVFHFFELVGTQATITIVCSKPELLTIKTHVFDTFAEFYTKFSERRVPALSALINFTNPPRFRYNVTCGTCGHGTVNTGVLQPNPREKFDSGGVRERSRDVFSGLHPGTRHRHVGDEFDETRRPNRAEGEGEFKSSPGNAAFPAQGKETGDFEERAQENGDEQELHREEGKNDETQPQLRDLPQEVFGEFQFAQRFRGGKHVRAIRKS